MTLATARIARNENEPRANEYIDLRMSPSTLNRPGARIGAVYGAGGGDARSSSA
jgi:hypothetical protein